MSTRLLLALFTLAAACCCARAEPLPLPDGTPITVSASSGTFFSRDDGYTADANPATATSSDAFGDIEFINADLALDFSADGVLRVYDNGGAGLLPDLTLTFVFSGLAGRLFDFSAIDLASLVGGSVLAEVVDPWTLRLSLAGATLSGPFESIALQLAVPEPAPLALLALALLPALRRRARNR